MAWIADVRRFRHRRLGMVLLLGLLAAALVHAPTAFGGVTLARDWSVNCVNWGGGQPDRNGVTRYVCNNQVIRIARNGSTMRMGLQLPPGGANVTDAAPSPDGTALYLSFYDDVFFQGIWDRKPVVGKFTYDGQAWRPVPGWQLANYPYGGRTWPALAYHITADWQGYLYVSTGLHPLPFDLPNTIVKYDAHGRYVTRFGVGASGSGADLSSWANGAFYVSNTGIGVTTDGRSVFVGEYGNGRVQRFDRRANGSYAYALKWGNSPATSNAQRDGRCVAHNDERGLSLGQAVGNEPGYQNRGLFAVVYDLVVDPANRVHVLNTTCSQIGTFDLQGRHIRTVQSGVRLHDVPHALVLTGHYDLLIPKGGDTNGASPYLTTIRDTAPPAWPVNGGGGGGVVGAATVPTIRKLSLRRRVWTGRRTVRLTVTATGDVNAMRVVDAAATRASQIRRGRWHRFAGRTNIRLSSRVGRHVVLVQLRDRRGKVSKVRAIVTRVQRDRRAPSLRRLRLANAGNHVVRVSTTARDNLSGVSGIRFALSRGAVGSARWYGYARALNVRFPSAGRFTLYVQVRDRAGYGSRIVGRTIVVS